MYFYRDFLFSFEKKGGNAVHYEPFWCLRGDEALRRPESINPVSFISSFQNPSGCLDRIINVTSKVLSKNQSYVFSKLQFL